MGEATVIRLDEPTAFAAMQAAFAADNPNLRLTLERVNGEAELRARHGGMRVFWIYRGAGEAFVPKGYRTQEGDGQPLPESYQPEQMAPAFIRKLDILEQGRASITPAARVAVSAILRRYNPEQASYTGDFAGELWKLDHLPRPWSTDPNVAHTLESLFLDYRQHGFSTKTEDSYEPVVPGDQLIACGEESIKVRGEFTCLAMENIERHTSHVSFLRRLRYLADTAGGCNPDFDPFRRLPLTWYYNYPGESGDGLNWVNSHVVNIPKETSPIALSSPENHWWRHDAATRNVSRARPRHLPVEHPRQGGIDHPLPGPA